MTNKNKRNLHYFEASSMSTLYDKLEDWQETNEMRLLSLNVQREGPKYCCIALSNPSEVVIVGKATNYRDYQEAEVFGGRLLVTGN